jgi:hypothetical protein
VDVQSSHLFGNPILWMTSSKKGQETESKALEISTLSNKLGRLRVGKQIGYTSATLAMSPKKT